jgi:hypothetical protein
MVKNVLDVDGLIDMLDVIAKKNVMKDVAAHIGKNENTLRNELNQQHEYKLGFRTALQIMVATGDLSVLDMIEAYFGRCCFFIPQAKYEDPAPMMRLVADMSHEFAESIRAIAGALSDGKICADEASRCIEQTKALVRKCIQIEANLKVYVGK